MSPAATLRRRLVTASVMMVVVLVVAVEVLLYVRMRSELLGGLEGPEQPGVDVELRRLLVVEALAAVLAAALATVLFNKVASAVLEPLEKMLDVVRSQTAGQRGGRIRPEAQCLIGALGQAYDDMLDAQERAIADTQAARDRSRRFLADGAHQIRTPIAGIQACAETLLRRPTGRRPADEEQVLSEMLHDTARVGRLVSDLLRAARLDQGVRLRPTACDLVAVCQHEIDRAQRSEPALHFRCLAPGWGRHRPLLDTSVVHEIVANLLDDARCRAVSRVTLTLARRASAIEVRVTDDGPRLSEQQAEVAFEPFRSSAATSGSGLELLIAFELARAHGGDLRYRDGSFVVRIPEEVPASIEPSPLSPRPVRREPASAAAR